ncbi:MAG TPA: GFA family protein [Rhizomicrobium sp.]|nr:GFA family protein [Rhizomicrobium sp.]
MIEGVCQCGAVRYAIPRLPEEVTSCNCTTCRKRGTLWAYYSPKEVRLEGRTSVFMWGDRDLEFHFCSVCACVSHWAPADRSYGRMGVNIRLLDPALWCLLPRMRWFDGADTWNPIEVIHP